MSCESENKPMAFLVFEGLDGSGKSTLIKKLHQLLKDRGLPSVLTHEPGGTSFAEEVRELILKTEGEPPVPMAELLLYQASRAQHVEQLIRPSLSQKNGYFVTVTTVALWLFNVGAGVLIEIWWMASIGSQQVGLILTFGCCSICLLRRANDDCKTERANPIAWTKRKLIFIEE
jgi:energy-coupling factor transporter ATP-binding protein EcfA2